MLELTKVEVSLISGGEGPCLLLGGTFNSTYSDDWPIGYGPCSPGCQAAGYPLCSERPDNLPPPEPHKESPSFWHTLGFVFFIAVGWLAVSVIEIGIVMLSTPSVKQKRT